MLRRRIALFAAAWFFAISLHAAEPRMIPTLTVDADDGGAALELKAVEVRTTIRGHLARTEYTLTYRSMLDRVTGGDFHFPLPPGAEVSDLGLYFGDHLRHAVSVERGLARVAYEEVVHRGVDPALAEWSAGRAFRLRVFPIPENGEKKVFIAYDQELADGDYVLDLRYGQTLDLGVTLDLDGRPVEMEGSLPMHSRDAVVDGIIRVAREPRETALVARSAADNAWYASAAIDVAAPQQQMAPAEAIVILYDTSSSSVKQNAILLRRFFNAFLAQQQAWSTAYVIPFHVALETPRRIDKAGTPAGQRELERVLAEQQPLGATNLLEVISQLPSLVATLPPSTRIVLVTDGIASLGDSREISAALLRLASLRRPLLMVNAASNADDQLLSNATRATGGWSVDLTRVDPEDAAAGAMRSPATIRFANTILPSAFVAAATARAAVAMRSTEPLLTLPLQRELTLRELHEPREVSMVRRAFARAQLREMLARGASDDELVAHGRAFTQMTPRTSLLVLESWRDYERYGIEMPPDVVAEKERYEADSAAMTPVIPTLPLPLPSVTPGPGMWTVSGVVSASDGSPLPGVTVALKDGTTFIDVKVTDVEGRFVLAAPTPPADPRVLAELVGYGRTERAFEGPSGTSVDVVIEMQGISEAITVTAAAPQLDVRQMATGTAIRTDLPAKILTTDDLLFRIANDAEADNDDPEIRKAVAQKRRELTREVVAKLRAIRSTAERVRYYLSARAMLGGDKSFHVFAAQAFRERSPEIAARVLSDLAEARPDDAPLLRILARVLEGWNEPTIARLLLQRALEVSPGEVQSWRELILLDAKHGRAREVPANAARLRAAKKGDWSIRELFEQTEEALTRWERATPAERQRGVDVGRDAEDDLTIDLMWDTGWSWVDVHITEPSGETVKWDHAESAAGGRFTGGYIFGYGPEIYSIRNAPRGTYRLDINYYGADRTNVSLESLAHVVIVARGPRGTLERREHFIVLVEDEQHHTLDRIEMR